MGIAVRLARDGRDVCVMVILPRSGAGRKVKYDSLESNEWIRPVRRGYKLACCDCGLVHRVDFKHVPWGRGQEILFRVRHDARATAARRRKGVIMVAKKKAKKKGKSKGASPQAGAPA